jgi:hypothetical protein
VGAGGAPAPVPGGRFLFLAGSFLPGPATLPKGSLSEEGLASAYSNGSGRFPPWALLFRPRRFRATGQAKPGTGGDRAYQAAGSRAVETESLNLTN